MRVIRFAHLVDFIKLYGISITCNLRWEKHTQSFCNNGSRILNTKHVHELVLCSYNVKVAPHKGLLGPAVENSGNTSTAWDPHEACWITLKAFRESGFQVRFSTSHLTKSRSYDNPQGLDLVPSDEDWSYKVSILFTEWVFGPGPCHGQWNVFSFPL